VTIDSEKLERVVAEVRRLRRITLVATGIALLATGLAAMALVAAMHVGLPAAPPTLTTSEMTVHDAAGQVRGRWSLQGLSLADRTGRMRAAITLGDEGSPNLTLFSKGGGVRAVVGLGAEDTPGITLHDAASRVRTRIVVGDGDAPSVTVTDAQGNVTARLPLPAATVAAGGRISARRGR
jgi:hypothetical protein